MTKNIFIVPSLWSDNFIGYKFGSWFLFLQSLNIVVL